MSEVKRADERGRVWIGADGRARGAEGREWARARLLLGAENRLDETRAREPRREHGHRSRWAHFAEPRVHAVHAPLGRALEPQIAGASAVHRGSGGGDRGSGGGGSGGGGDVVAGKSARGTMAAARE